VRLKNLFQFIKQKLIELNLFKTVPPSTDETIIQQQRYQTRLYLVSSLIALTILTIYVSFKTKTITYPIESPSITTFNELAAKHPSTFNCPCSQISLEYNQFISDIKVEYHEICLSEFITSRWIDLQFNLSPKRIFVTHDIRYQSQMHFQLLSTLCRVAKQTFDENLQSFNRTKFITHQVIKELDFYTQINIIIEQFRGTILESYKRTLQLIEANPEINQFVVPLNSEFTPARGVNRRKVYRLKPREHAKISSVHCINSNSECFCHDFLGDECLIRTIILEDNSSKIIIPGIIQATFPLRSVLLSTLECFYNETCLSYIIRKINDLGPPKNFSILHRSSLSINKSKYSKIEELAYGVFIKSWSNKSSYKSYFNHCHPLTCQYTDESPFNIMDIIITMTGIFGGVNFVLLFLVPCIIKLSYYIWAKISLRQQNRIRPSEETIFTRTGKNTDHENLF
jgi:hypothetical protein